MEQKIITSKDQYAELDEWVRQNGIKKILLVCGRSIRFQKELNEHLEELDRGPVTVVRFSDFHPNPLYESVVHGVSVFRNEGCDAVMAVGGGTFGR